MNFFNLPIGAGQNDWQFGEVDGNPIYHTPGGFSYFGQYQAPAAPYESLTTALDPQGRAVHNRAPVAKPSLMGAIDGMVGGITQGLTAPGRAARGEPVTYGDAWATALDYGALSAPTEAPAGALRSGGIRAYHGSPHDFDRFSMDKIGTGEGAQAYGHGLYFAEAEDVAKGYRDDLTDGLRLHGKPIDTVWNDEIRERWPEIYNGLSEADADEMDALLGTMANMRSMIDMENAAESVGRRAQHLFRSRVKPGLADAPPGRMYEVRINANPDDFLDWDAPLSEQSPVARQAVQPLLERYLGSAYDGQISNYERKTLGDLLNEVDRMPARQAAQLAEGGAPGIKYKDGMSRGGEGGTRNFVVFDEDLIEIVRKYGIAGAATYLGMPEDEIRDRVGGA